VIAWRIHAGDPHFVSSCWRSAPAFCVGSGTACSLPCSTSSRSSRPDPDGVWRGIGLMINLIYGGTNPSFTSPLLQGLSVGHVGLVPTRLLVGAGIFVALWLLIRRTAFGLFLGGGGRQPKAARLAGVNARLILYSAYIVSGCALRRRASFWTRYPTSGSRQCRALHRARRDPRRGDRRRLLSGGPHLSRRTVLGALVIQALTRRS